MDDVSRFQKITSIARELIDKGQASSMQSAMRLAEQQLSVRESSVDDIPPPPLPPMDQLPDLDDIQISQPKDTHLNDAQISNLADESQNNEPVADTVKPTGVQQQPVEHVHKKLESALLMQKDLLNKIVQTVNAQSAKVDNVEKKINSLIAELAGLKDDIEKMKQNPVVAPPLKTKDVKEGQTQFKSEQQAAQPQPKPEEKKAPSGGHVRSGNYKPDDVSIEKFFYYGNR